MKKVSIIIPVYNGEEFIEEAILSFLEQEHSEKELLIMDGGSTDSTVSIIRKYESRLAYWVSEQDGGQSNAINRGFSRATGEILNWLCCDDRLEKGALSKVVRHFNEEPDEVKVIAGAARIVNRVKGKTSHWKPTHQRLALMPCVNPFPQPSTFFKANSVNRGEQFVLPDHHFSMDFEMWNRIRSLHGSKAFHLIDDTLSSVILTEDNKTSVGGLKVICELDRVYRKYSKETVPLSTLYRMTRMPLDAYYIKNPGAQRKGSKFMLWKLYSYMLNAIYTKDRVYAISQEWKYFYRQS